MLIFVSSLFLVLLSPFAYAGPFLQGGGPDGLVSIEVENFRQNVPASGHQWIAGSSAGASNGSSLITTPNNGALINTGYAAASPRFDFDVDFVQAGTHYVWLRGIGDSDGASQDDSIHVGFDGQEISTSDRVTSFNSGWTCSTTTMDGGQVATINVPTPGVHTINIWMREDGLEIDKLVLTVNAAYIRRW